MAKKRAQKFEIFRDKVGVGAVKLSDSAQLYRIIEVLLRAVYSGQVGLVTKLLVGFRIQRRLRVLSLL